MTNDELENFRLWHRNNSERKGKINFEEQMSSEIVDYEKVPTLEEKICSVISLIIMFFFLFLISEVEHTQADKNQESFSLHVIEMIVSVDYLVGTAIFGEEK